MNNPFTLTMVSGKDFCNRKQEFSDLKDFAYNGQHVVLYSPRRYGKSSLINGMLLPELQKEEFLTVYVDLFSVISEQDFISKLASGVIRGIGRGANPVSFKDRMQYIFTRLIPGFEVAPDGNLSISVKVQKDTSFELLLEDVLQGMYGYIQKREMKACVALDEFQEITELKESKRIEGSLRSYIQWYRDVSFFFVGSRRRILKEMFTDKTRAFYNSAFLYNLKEIPEQDFVPYIRDQFNKTGKTCPQDIAAHIYKKTKGFPYYTQKLSYFLWNLTDNEADERLFEKALNTLLQTETPEYESVWIGLPLMQKTLLKALALAPTTSPFAKDYLAHYNLSVGGTQKALPELLKKDLIEKEDNTGAYRPVDPIMALWLRYS